MVAHDPEATKRKEADTRRTKKEESLQEWLHAKEDLFDGIDFSVEYLGYSEVNDPTGRQNSAETIHKLLQKKPENKVTLRVTVNGLLIPDEDFDKSHPMAFVQIYRISWTMVDRIRRKVFCFIARDKTTRKLLLHIFQCSTRRQASTITLTVAQAFQIAFDAFKKKDKETQKAVAQKLKEQELEDAKAEAEAEAGSGAQDQAQPQPEEEAQAKAAEELDYEYEEIPEIIPEDTTSSSEKTAKEPPEFKEKPLLRRRGSSRKVSVKLHHRQSVVKRPISGDEEDKLIEMPDEDIKEEFKRLTLKREIPDLPEMDFDPDDKTDEVAQFLTGGKTAEHILEEKEDAD